MKWIKASTDHWQEGRGYTKKVLLRELPLPAEVSFLQEVRFKKGDTVPFHFHRVQTEIFYVLGEGSITINGIEMMLGQGDIVVCEPGDVHGNPSIDKEFGFLVLKIDHREDDTVWV